MVVLTSSSPSVANTEDITSGLPIFSLERKREKVNPNTVTAPHPFEPLCECVCTLTHVMLSAGAVRTAMACPSDPPTMLLPPASTSMSPDWILRGERGEGRGEGGGGEGRGRGGGGRYNRQTGSVVICHRRTSHLCQPQSREEPSVQRSPPPLLPGCCEPCHSRWPDPALLLL